MLSNRSGWRVVVLLVLLTTGPTAPSAFGAQPPQQPKAARDEFLPIDQLPPDEKLPAARLLIAAYSVAWVAVSVYLWSIWRRLARVEQEIADVTRRIQQGGLATPKPRSGEGGSR